MLPFASKVALVTGAAGIIGPDICAALQGAGWKIAATDKDAEKFARYGAVYRKPFPADLQIPADLTLRSECLRVIDETRALGPIALLIHGATGSEMRAFAQIDEALLERIAHLDILTPFYLAQAAAPDLAAQRGLIIHLSSVMVNNVLPGHLPYIVAKAAVEKMVECLAVELAPQAIRVNGIRIGFVPGDGFLRPAMDLLPPDLAAQLREEIFPLHLQSLKGASLTGRAGLAPDVAAMILHLASPSAVFIDGAILPVDGGFNLAGRSSTVHNTGSPYPERWLKHPLEEVRGWLKEKGIVYEL